MRLLKFILGALLFGAALVALAFPLVPTRWYVERMVSVAAPAEAVWALAGDVERWPEWNPWAKDADPTLTEGHVVWSSDAVGEGMLTLTSVEPGKRLKFTLSLEDGRFRGTGALFVSTVGNQTRVSWLAEGSPSDLGGRLYAPLLQMLMGRQIDEGLLALKAAVEGPAPAKPAASPPTPSEEPEPAPPEPGAAAPPPEPAPVNPPPEPEPPADAEAAPVPEPEREREREREPEAPPAVEETP